MTPKEFEPDLRDIMQKAIDKNLRHENLRIFAVHAPITWRDAIDSLADDGEKINHFSILNRVVDMRLDYAKKMVFQFDEMTKDKTP